MTCEHIQNEDEAVAAAAGVVAELSAERMLMGLELQAERDGVTAATWARDEMRGLWVSTIIVCLFPLSGEFGYSVYAGYAGLPEVNASVSRHEAVAFVAQEKARLAEVAR